MQVPIRVFYGEVTGKAVDRGSTRTAQDALQRWGIPFVTETPENASKRYWKVDTKHVEQARARYTAEQAAKEAKRPKKKTVTPEGMGIMERMANVEQELRTLNVALTGFIKKFEP